MIRSLEGEPNCRDLGGTPATGGVVRERHLLRAGALGELTDRDVAALAEVGPMMVFDLRSTREVDDAPPDRLPPSAEWIHRPIDEADVVRSIVTERLASGTFDPPDEDLMVRAYRRIAGATDTLRSIMNQVIDDGRAVLIHCTHGKDRTGAVTALVLALSGVDWATIETDFLRSNEGNAARTESNMQMVRSMAPEDNPDALSWVRTFFEVEPRYLAAARHEWGREWGSFDGFVADSLGIGPAETARLRARLVE